METWTQNDQTIALAQGWGVFECIDMRSKKVFMQIMREGPRFTTEHHLDLFIKYHEKQRDPLVSKAVRLVFQSKTGAHYGQKEKRRASSANKRDCV